MVRVFRSLQDVALAAGSDIGVSDWLTIDQGRINGFAEASDDFQWIHVDEQRAASGPFGRTIAHGFLTLSLLPHFAADVFSFEMPGAVLNYGLDKVRFPMPVPVGARLRSHVHFGDVTNLASGKQLVIQHTVELDGAEKPACVASHVVLLLS